MTGIVGTTGASSGEIGEITKAAGAAGGKHVSTQTFTSNGIWTRPAGVTRIFVEMVGGGGGAVGHAESGGAGGYSAEVIDVSTDPGNITVTIGGYGNGSTYTNTAQSGGTSSFGPYLSATGGAGGQGSPQHSGGVPGDGSGGDQNHRGGGGSGHCNTGPGVGGSANWGGGTSGGHSTASTYSSFTWEGQCAYGGGGAASYTSLGRGAHGRAGYVVVWEYS